MKRVVITIIVVLFAGPVWALTYMGPPTSDIEAGQFGIGFDYSESETNIEIKGLSGVLTDVEANTHFARFILGIGDGAELSARVGTDEIEDLGNEFAWGLGVKATLVESGSLNWGALFQLTGLYGDETDTVSGFAITGDFDVYEYQVAVGPTLKINSLSVYGGPFVHFIDGDGDIRILGTTLSYDFEQESEFGGYVGLSWNMGENTSFAVEYQATDDADAIGIGLVHRFGKPSGHRIRVGPKEPSTWPTLEQNRPKRPAETGPKQRLKTDASGQPVKDKDGNFIFVPVEQDAQ
jgi:hypothetical protein